MSNAEASPTFVAPQIEAWGTVHSHRNGSECFGGTEQGLGPLRPIIRPSVDLYDFKADLRHPVQPPVSQFPFERLIRFSFSFDPFCLIPAQRLLLDAKQPVRIGSRAMDLLIALVEQAGKILTKQELIKRVWPNLFVEEHNLKVQMSELRRVLGDRQAGRRYVLTVPGRGYTFVAQVRRENEPRNRIAAADPLWTEQQDTALSQ
jgi:DNA-binding winged helix-turn-helix (wHTH) protein